MDTEAPQPPPVPDTVSPAPPDTPGLPEPEIGEVVPPRKGQRAEFWVMVGLVILADIELYANPGGTGVAILMLATLGALLALYSREGGRNIVPVAGLTLACAGMLVWDADPLRITVSALLIFVTSIRMRSPEWSVTETLGAIPLSLALSPVELVKLPLTAGRAKTEKDRPEAADEAANRDDAPEPSAPSAPRRRINAQAIAIPLVLCVVFLGIFRNANPVLDRAMDRVDDLFGDVFKSIGDLVEDLIAYLDFDITPLRVIIWGFWALLFAAVLRPLLAYVTAQRMIDHGEALRNADTDTAKADKAFATASATLISLNIMFFAYNAMDAVYLYFKATLPDGITWTQYTHAGCGWLTFGLFLSNVIISVIFWQSLNFHPRTRRLRLLAYVWAAQNLVLAVGALRRLQLYIDYSGLTPLRITGSYGCILVAIGLALVVYRVYAGRNLLWLFRRNVLAFSLALTLLALEPNHWISATYNVARMMEGKARALRPICLKTLPAEALPPVLGLLDYEDADPERQAAVREGMAALLGRSLEDLDRREPGGHSTFSGAAVWAHARLDAERARILEICPPEDRDRAWTRIIEDYDLTYIGSRNVLRGMSGRERM